MPKQGSSYAKHVATLPWLILSPFHRESHGYKLLHRLFILGLLAFDRDGGVDRRTIFPLFKRDDLDFPFYAGGLEEEVLMELVCRFDWDDASDDDTPF
ncbi:hypothetical protein OROGR_015434 [Orobanche gracilis]